MICVRIKQVQEAKSLQLTARQ